MTAGGAITVECVVRDSPMPHAAARGGAANQMILNNSIESAAIVVMDVQGMEETVSATDTSAVLLTTSSNGQYSEQHQPSGQGQCPQTNNRTIQDSLNRVDTLSKVDTLNKVDTLSNMEASQEDLRESPLIIDLIAFQPIL